MLQREGVQQLRCGAAHQRSERASNVHGRAAPATAVLLRQLWARTMTAAANPARTLCRRPLACVARPLQRMNYGDQQREMQEAAAAAAKKRRD